MDGDSEIGDGQIESSRPRVRSEMDGDGDGNRSERSRVKENMEGDQAL